MPAPSKTAATLRSILNVPRVGETLSDLARGLMTPRTNELAFYVDADGNLVSAAGTVLVPQDGITATTPLTGATITEGTTGASKTHYITPAGTIAALTYVFPSNANSRIGQRITLISTQNVTTLTVTSTDLTLNGDAVTTLQANVPVSWIKVATSTWQRTDATAVQDVSFNGTITSADPTTPILATAAGKTNTGYLSLTGKTSGSFKVLPADAMAYTLTTAITAQTVGTATITIPDFANVSDTFAFCTLAQTFANKTLTTPVVADGLTASGSAANTFAGSTGTFATSTGLNTLSGFTTFKGIFGTPIAAAGSTVADAGQLGAANVVLVSSDGATKGVKLQTGVAGQIVHVINTTATACELYAASGGTVNGLGADASVVVPASKGLICYCTAADTWLAFDMTAAATAS